MLRTLGFIFGISFCAIQGQATDTHITEDHYQINLVQTRIKFSSTLWDLRHYCVQDQSIVLRTPQTIQSETSCPLINLPQAPHTQQTED